ncbi:MAG: GNAT family N-acetyltransferase [Oscillospiraceae bacterium]|nr:GNAT family N-acetyltransferase [Oscillospiraceae bacterium]
MEHSYPRHAIPLETDRLILRRFTPDDWKDLNEYLSQPETVCFEPYEPFSMEDSKREAVTRSENAAFLAVCLKSGGKLIGNIYIAPQDYGAWELGYVFNSKFWRNGYATEAARAAIEYAFANSARRVTAMCNPLNEASWKLLERLGFTREGHLRKNIFFKRDEQSEPIWQDTYEYAILEDAASHIQDLSERVLRDLG